LDAVAPTVVSVKVIEEIPGPAVNSEPGRFVS